MCFHLSFADSSESDVCGAFMWDLTDLTATRIFKGQRGARTMLLVLVASPQLHSKIQQNHFSYDIVSILLTYQLGLSSIKWIGPTKRWRKGQNPSHFSAEINWRADKRLPVACESRPFLDQQDDAVLL